MVKVARCESGLRQYGDDGKVLKGKQNPLDSGIFQLNSYYWLEKSKELGFDIYTTEGNIAMAKWIYDREGTKPWNWSRGCWSL